MKTNENENKKVYELTIDGKPYTWNEQFITGSQIKKLGNIPPDYEIFLKIKGAVDDKLIGDNDKVDLGLPGMNDFYGCKTNTNNG